MISPTTELEVNLTPTTEVAETVGAISWDLPSSLQYAPDSDLSVEVSIVNIYSTSRVFSVVIYLLDENRALLDEQVLEFTQDTETFTAFQLEPGHEIGFTLSLKINTADIYLGMQLYVCKQENTAWLLDEVVDYVEVWLAAAPIGNGGFNIGSIMPLMIVIMMMGMIMPMMKTAGGE